MLAVVTDLEKMSDGFQRWVTHLHFSTNSSIPMLAVVTNVKEKGNGFQNWPSWKLTFVSGDSIAPKYLENWGTMGFPSHSPLNVEDFAS